MRSLTVEKYTGKGRGPKLIPKTLQHIDPMDEGKSAKYTSKQWPEKEKTR